MENSNHNAELNFLILGADGYLGWSLLTYLRKRGYNNCVGIDNFLRRKLVAAGGSDSLTPIGPPGRGGIQKQDLTQPLSFPANYVPDVIVHFAEIPSAPYSMQNVTTCVDTQTNNVAGTLRLLWAMKEHWPEAHLIKLGTMGEYSDWIYDHPKLTIPESPVIFVKSENDIQMQIPTPRWAGSYYHWSKIYDSFNIQFACRAWGLRATDLNQGVVYGTRIDEMESGEELTRFDYDEAFGTVINRFVVEAVLERPLTVYGEGGQTRGFININDAMRAIELVATKDPPVRGEFRVINQLTEVFSVLELARMVADLGCVPIESLPNPRQEREEHSYWPEAYRLVELGLTNPRSVAEMLPQMYEDVERFKDRIVPEVIPPRTSWK